MGLFSHDNDIEAGYGLEVVAGVAEEAEVDADGGIVAGGAVGGEVAEQLRQVVQSEEEASGQH